MSKLLFIAIAFVSAALSQTSVISPYVDDNGATITIRKRDVAIRGTVLKGGGTALPGTCTVGDQYFLTTGTTGNYQCTATNAWTLPGSGGGGGAAGSIIKFLEWRDFPLGVVQGAGCSLAGSVLTATAPTCYTFAGSSTLPQFGRPQFSATGNALYLDFVLPDDYIPNSALTFEWHWINPTDTNTAHVVMWDINQYGCTAAGGAAQPALISGAAAAATAIQASSANTSSATLALTPSGSGAGNCAAGARLFLITTLNALTATDAPVLTRFRVKYARNQVIQ